MPYKDPAAKQAWRERNRAKQRQYQRQFKERALAKGLRTDGRPRTERKPKQSRQERNRKIVENTKRYTRQRRTEALRRFGAACQDCGFDDPRALHFDHIEPLNRRRRGLKRQSQYELYGEIARALDAHERYQLLCANCHWRKTLADRRAGKHDIGAIIDASQPPDEKQLALDLDAGPPREEGVRFGQACFFLSQRAHKSGLRTAD